MGERTQLAINVILPGVETANDACVERLLTVLRGRKGIETAHVADETGAAQNHLCIHYEPRIVSLPEVRKLVEQAGAELDRRYGHLLLQTHATHARQARTAELRAKEISGVLDASISPAGIVRVEFDRRQTTDEDVRRALASVGLSSEASTAASPPTPQLNSAESHDHEHGQFFGEQTELLFAGISGALLLGGWLLDWGDGNPWAILACFVIAYAFGGFFTLRETFENLRAGRFEIDFLMLVAALGAALLGKWFEGALLLFLFSLGHALENYAMGRAKQAIEALAGLAPQTAIIRRGGATQEVPVEQLVVGDTVLIKPNERIPADGFVTRGESSVDQAPITGESVPVDKRAVADPVEAAKKADRLEAEFRVFTGTINQSGALEIQVTKLSSESALARVVQMVNEAETQKSDTQLFTDRFERYFVPSVIGLAVLLLGAWLVIDESFSQSFYRAMAVLVASSPCALAISTPSAVLSGVARAARGGVLIKGGAPLENLGTVRALAFDKTGTLTEGKPRLTDVVAFEGTAETELLRVAIAVERLSDHPLAQAVARGGMERLGQIPVPEAEDLQSITGRGVRASVENQLVLIGKDDLFREVPGVPLPDTLRTRVEGLEREGRTTMIVRRGDMYLGVLGLMDTPRQAAKDMVERLRSLGIQRMIMLSGDNQQVADAVAKAVGIDEARGDLMPNDKVEVIKQLSETDGVAMIGDGVNDAPALANATVGVAMGAAGSDVALETADVALMADDLAHLPFAVGLSRRTRSIIRQNLWFSLGMVAVLIPATIFGLQMGAAVLFHEGSTLLVVGNALRLLAYEEH